MNVGDEAKVDRILAQADTFIQESSPELWGAVQAGPLQFTLFEQKGWHPDREATAECPGPFPVFHIAIDVDVKRCDV